MFFSWLSSSQICAMLSLTNSYLGEDKVEYTKEELIEAKRQIDSTLHKLREVIKLLNQRKTRHDISRKSPWQKGVYRLLKLQITLLLNKSKASDNSRLLVAYSCLNSAPAGYALS